MTYKMRLRHLVSAVQLPRQWFVSLQVGCLFFSPSKWNAPLIRVLCLCTTVTHALRDRDVRYNVHDRDSRYNMWGRMNTKAYVFLQNSFQKRHGVLRLYCVSKFVCTVNKDTLQYCDIKTQQHTATQCCRRPSQWLCHGLVTRCPWTMYEYRHTATQRNTLQHTATHCNTLQLQHTAAYRNILQQLVGLITL